MNDIKLGLYCEKIIGKPGTGKTTRLASVILPYFRNDFDYYARRIMGANFSRSSATALRNKFRECDIEVDHLPFFRTIHSLSAKVLDLKKKEDFVQSTDFLNFCQKHKLPFKSFRARTLDEIELFGVIGEDYTPIFGNILFRWFQALKRKYIYPNIIKSKIPLRAELTEREIMALDAPTEFLNKLYTEWEEWKHTEGKFEYDDMLQSIVINDIPFLEDIIYAVVDEFQDLSPLQIKLLSLWLQDTKKVWTAGDPMQGIYYFNQADSAIFENLQADNVIVLPRSYRVPAIPWMYTADFAHLCGDRTIDAVSPANHQGDFLFISFSSLLQELKTSNRTFFILSRTNFEVYDILKMLFQEKIPIRGLGRTRTAFDDHAFLARYNLITKLYAGEPLTYDEVYFIIMSIPADYLKRGVKASFKKHKWDFWVRDDIAPLDDVDTHALFYNLFISHVGSARDIKNILADPMTLKTISVEKKNYLLNLNPTYKPIVGEKLNKFIGTIHAAKGLEADNVAIFDYLPNRYAIMKDEFRLIAVAISRTLDNTFVVPFSESIKSRDYIGIIEQNIRIRHNAA